MSALRHPAFLAAYHLLPHRLVNGSARWATRRKRPRWLVRWAIDAWIRRDRIDMADFEPGPFETLEAFFLRRLRPGARPLAAGVVSPVDGTVVAAGAIAPGIEIAIKGHSMSLARVVGGESEASLAPFAGGRFVSLFLSPRGYHRIHMPADGTLVDVAWIPGRFFPQNEDALAHIPRVYERNERAVLRLETAAGPILLVLVGASVVGGIELEGVPRTRWARLGVTALGLPRARADEVGHFTFGSTVVVLLPRGAGGETSVGREIRMGGTLAPGKTCDSEVVETSSR